MRLLPLLLLTACDPYAGWPFMHQAFPWGIDDDQVLEPYEEVRWEAGPWDPETEPEFNGLYVQKALLHRPGTPTQAAYHWGLMRPSIPALQTDQLFLTFAGDILHTGPVPTDFSGIADRLDGGLRIGNLETPVAPSVVVGEGPPGVPLFNAPAELLDDIPFEVLQFNNNHTLDAGDAGLEETLLLLEERGIVGTGIDGSVAAYELEDGTVLAFVSYTWGLNQPDVDTVHDVGVVPFGEPGTRASGPDRGRSGVPAGPGRRVDGRDGPLGLRVRVLPRPALHAGGPPDRPSWGRSGGRARVAHGPERRVVHGQHSGFKARSRELQPEDRRRPGPVCRHPVRAGQLRHRPAHAAAAGRDPGSREHRPRDRVCSAWPGKASPASRTRTTTSSWSRWTPCSTTRTTPPKTRD